MTRPHKMCLDIPTLRESYFVVGLFHLRAPVRTPPTPIGSQLPADPPEQAGLPSR